MTKTAMIFFALYAAFSAAHVAAIFLKKERFRAVSKACLMPPLFAAYLTGAPQVLPLAAAALVLGWAGDILLLWNKKPAFYICGLVSFLTGHVLYLVSFARIAGSFAIAPGIVFIVIAAAVGIVMYRFIKPRGEMAVPIAVYMAVILTMGLFALQLLIAHPSWQGALIFAASLCFMTSDSILGYYSFRPLVLWAAVAIMVFYLLAQAGIIIGLMFL